VRVDDGSHRSAVQGAVGIDCNLAGGIRNLLYTNDSFHVQFSSYFLLAENVAGDNDALDLARALVDLGDLGVAHHALNRVILGVAVAAVDLDRLGGDLHGSLGSEQLGGSSVEGEGLAFGLEGSRLVGQQAGSFDGNVHVGEDELGVLELRDRTAELLTGL